MKKMVRLISAVMVIVMMFSMATSAFADRVAVTGGGTTVHTGTSIVGGGSANSGGNGTSISANTRPTHYTAPDGSVKTTTDLNVTDTAEAPKYLGNGDIDYEAILNSDDENIANNADFIMYIHDNLDNVSLQNDGTIQTAYALFGEEVIEGDAFVDDKEEESDCEHEWVEATCTAPKTCSKCGATEGAALPHDFAEHEDGSITCNVCGVAYCEANGHSWNDNGDGTRTCNVCGVTEGEHVHSFSAATCTEPEVCSCGEIRGDALGHSFVNGICQRCGAADPNYMAPTSEPEQLPETPATTEPAATPEIPVVTEPTAAPEAPVNGNPAEAGVINANGVAYVGQAKQKVIHADAIAYTGSKSNIFNNVAGRASLISSLGAEKITFNQAFDICNSTDYRITINMKGTEVVAPSGGYAFIINDGNGAGSPNRNVSSITFTNGSISGNGFWVEKNGVLNLGGLVNNKVDILVHNGATAVYVEEGGTAVIGQGTQLYSSGGSTVVINQGGQARMSGGLIELRNDTTNYAVLNQGTFLLNASGYSMNDSNGVVRNENGVAILTNGGVSNTTIGAGTVIGKTGIAISDKGSNLLMYNGTVTGKGAYSLSWLDTGSAIVALSPEGNEPTVTVSGGTLRSEKSAAIINLTADGTRKAKDTTVNITLFTEGIITQQAAGMYSDFRVAKFTVNDIGYASLKEAIDAANASTDPTVTIKMGGNYTVATAADSPAITGSNIIFDGNGYTLEVADGIDGLTVDGANASVTIKNIDIVGTYGTAKSGVLINNGNATVGGAVTISKFLRGVETTGGSVYINDVYLPDSIEYGVYCSGGVTVVAMITDDCDKPVYADSVEMLVITGGWFKRDIAKGETDAKYKVSTYIDPAQSHLKWIDADKYYEVLYNNEPTVTLISPTTATVSGDKTYIEYDKNIYEANAEPLIFEFDAGCIQVDAVSYNAARTVYPIFTCTTTDSKGNVVGATGKVRVADLSVLKDLPAGAYDLVFTFANGAKITDKLVLKVYPAVFMAFKVPNSSAMSNLEPGAVKEYVIDDNRLYKTGYNVDDQENILVLMSELPEKVAVGSHSYPYGEDVNQKTYIEYYINGNPNGSNSSSAYAGTCMKIPADSSYGSYAPGNYAFFISYADLNNLVPGQNFVFADYGDTLYQIEKPTDEYASVMEEFNMENDDVFITPTSVKWSTLSGMAYFTVKPDILNSDSADCASVYIDGECVPKQYWTYDKDTNSLGFKTEYLKQLPKEVHTLEVITSNGKVGATIETNVGLAPKDLDYHVYGGAKSLSFVASDKINKEGGIWIGSNNPVKLDPSCYVWDSDTGFTLSAAFLNRLNLGTYYISAYVWDGSQYVYRTTSFKVISASQASYNPSTGDNSKIFIWIIVLALSAVAIVVILLPRFKKKEGGKDTKSAEKNEKK